MKTNNDPKNCIYPTIKEYKRKRLFYSSHFRNLYNGDVEPAITENQYLYRMCIHCWLQRLREEDIVTVIGAWWKKHNTVPKFAHLRHVVIPRTYEWTNATVKAQKKAENERAKAKREVAR